MIMTIYIFAIATIINVILSTLRSLFTIKAGKLSASIMNAICYGFYTWVVVLTVSDISLWIKILITALANFVGVYIVKLLEEKSRKDKLWKIEMAIPKEEQELVAHTLIAKDIPHNCIELGDRAIFNCYCATQQQTKICKDITVNLNGKISAYESQSLL